jgi:ribosomal protein S10
MKSYNPTLIEDAFKAIVINGGVDTTVYKNRPKSGPQKESFVVVECSSSIEDKRTFADGHVGIHLFARDISNMKNDVRLTKMFDKLMEVMPAEVEVKADGEVKAAYVVEEPLIMPDVADNFGFHARILDYPITLKNV